MQCHCCGHEAAYAAEKDHIKVGLCERHFRKRVEELVEPEELAALKEKLDINRTKRRPPHNSPSTNISLPPPCRPASISGASAHVSTWPPNMYNAASALSDTMVPSAESARNRFTDILDSPAGTVSIPRVSSIVLLSGTTTGLQRSN